MGGTVRRRRAVGGWLRGDLLATDRGDETNDEPVGTVRGPALWRQREALSARFCECRVGPRETDPILIGPVGRWRSREVLMVDVVCRQGPPRLVKSAVTRLGAGTRRSDGRTVLAGEEL